MQNIIKIHAWAEPYVNFLLGETSPLTFMLSRSRSTKNHHFNKLGRLHIPNATYQVPR